MKAVEDKMENQENQVGGKRFGHWEVDNKEIS